MAGGVCNFGVLGPLVLERDGVDVPLPSGRQRSLLALLLLGAGVPLTRDRLIDELWGERPPASGCRPSMSTCRSSEACSAACSCSTRPGTR